MSTATIETQPGNLLTIQYKVQQLRSGNWEVYITCGQVSRVAVASNRNEAITTAKQKIIAAIG